MEQRSDEWFRARLGKVTASGVSKILPGKSGKYSTSRATYMTELICQELTQIVPEQGYMGKAVERGNEKEPDARYEYEGRHGMVDLFGFQLHPEIPKFGASPDFICKPDGGGEIKCPNTETHLKTIIEGFVKPEYIVQMNVNMMCFGAKWWDFVSFDDRLPAGLAYYEKRFIRDELLCSEIKTEVEIFVSEMEERLMILKAHMERN